MLPTQGKKERKHLAVKDKSKRAGEGSAQWRPRTGWRRRGCRWRQAGKMTGSGSHWTGRVENRERETENTLHRGAGGWRIWRYWYGTRRAGRSELANSHT